MLYIDPAVGSGDLDSYFSRLKLNVPTSVTHLDFGDVNFMGNGPDGPLMIAVEIKRVGDLIQSRNTKRLPGHQLPGLHDMMRTGAVIWLLIQDPYKPDARTGELLVLRQGGWGPVHAHARIQYETFESYLISMQVRGGLHLAYTQSRNATARWIAACYHNWQEPWESHRSHLGIYAPASPMILTRKPTWFRRVVNQLPGIGWEKSKRVEDYFKTLNWAFNAPGDRWTDIEGIGEKTAQTLQDLIFRGKEPPG